MDCYNEIPSEYLALGKFGKLLWDVEKENDILTEGLVTSYPFSNVLAMLNRKYSEVISHIQSDIFSEHFKDSKTRGISLYIKKSLYNENLLNQIKKDVDAYGYVVTFAEKYNINEIGVFIEPKFPFIIEPKYLKNKKLFHTTNIKYLEKIQKIGLTPRDSQTNFNHPGNRIYLMASTTPKTINDFKITLAKNKNWNLNDMVILEVEPRNLVLYYDPNFDFDVKTDIAVFTFKNIHPNQIKLLK